MSSCQPCKPNFRNSILECPSAGRISRIPRLWHGHAATNGAFAAQICAWVDTNDLLQWGGEYFNSMPPENMPPVPPNVGPLAVPHQNPNKANIHLSKLWIAFLKRTHLVDQQTLYMFRPKSVQKISRKRSKTPFCRQSSLTKKTLGRSLLLKTIG